jgi:hypothetical protein
MSNSDTRRDKDGYVYERNLDGSYDKKWDYWKQDYERDNAELEYQPDGTDRNGTPIYRMHEASSSHSMSGSSPGSGESILGPCLVTIGIVMAVVTQVIILMPVISPILLVISENARKSGDLRQMNKLKPWSILATLLATLVVFSYAIIMSIAVSMGFATLTRYVDSPLIIFPMCLLAVMLGVIVFVLLFVTGMSATTIVYLLQEETRQRISGNTEFVKKIRLVRWGIGITAFTTIALWILVAFIALVIEGAGSIF